MPATASLTRSWSHLRPKSEMLRAIATTLGRCFREAEQRGQPSAGRPRVAIIQMTLAAANRSLGTLGPGLRKQIIPIEVHDLVPGCHEIAHELILRVVAGVDLG